MKALLVIAILLVLAPFASADSVTCGWEGGVPVLGLYGTGEPPIFATFSAPPDPCHGGLHSLRLEDNSPTGTPQAYVAWITGLADGDVVEATVWRYDTTPDASPSCRIWAHWNDDPLEVNGYNGSAGGNDDYGLGEGWDLVGWSWSVVDGHTGLVIEIRTYSEPGDVVWVDDMTVMAPEHASILIPEAVSSVEDQSWSGIKAFYR
jgi:hypothetical protein